MTKVKGLAVPYNVANEYGETVLPGALEKFLEAWKCMGIPMPMMQNHKTVVGYWNAFADKPNGLYLRGVANDNVKLDGMKLSPAILTKGNFLWTGLLNLNRELNLREPITLGKRNVFALSEVSLTATPSFTTTWVKAA